jgi:hypothetical protein
MLGIYGPIPIEASILLFLVLVKLRIALNYKLLHVVRLDVLICTLTILGFFSTAIAFKALFHPRPRGDRLTATVTGTSWFVLIVDIVLVLPYDCLLIEAMYNGRKSGM